MTELNRRATDTAGYLDIEKMILEEEDKKQRAFLIVLNSINNSLIANTETIKDVSEKLDAHLTSYENHVEQEDALLNKGRGAWWVVAWVIGVVQVVGLGIWGVASNDIREIHASLKHLETRMAVVEKVTEKK